MSEPSLFALVAGETSGDHLGASLISNLKRSLPEARFVGIGGDAMIQQGLECWTSLEKLSVNGLIDPLLRLPEFLKLLIGTRNRIIAAKPACFISIDFNFFNLFLAGMLKKRGITTVHYVSPTVWAWRKHRINSIAKKVDLMLTLYPFELAIYQQNNIKAVFVGHPKANEISLDEGVKGQQVAKAQYGYAEAEVIIAILPGSRKSEIALSGPDFLRTAVIIHAHQPDMKFIIPAVNAKRKQQIDQLVLAYGKHLPIKVTLGEAKIAMQAADLVLVNSGTATLEAMLLKKPMVMSYRLNTITYAIVSRLVQTKFFALPNILAQKALVPEFIQGQAQPDDMAATMIRLLNEDHKTLKEIFNQIHLRLRKNAGASSAQAILNLLENKFVSM